MQVHRQTLRPWPDTQLLPLESRMTSGLSASRLIAEMSRTPSLLRATISCAREGALIAEHALERLVLAVEIWYTEV